MVVVVVRSDFTKPTALAANGTDLTHIIINSFTSVEWCDKYLISIRQNNVPFRFHYFTSQQAEAEKDGRGHLYIYSMYMMHHFYVHDKCGAVAVVPELEIGSEKIDPRYFLCYAGTSISDQQSEVKLFAKQRRSATMYVLFGSLPL